MNDEKEDENPWDEEDAGRTLATASPSFDSNVPSPITVPPPAIPETSPTIPRPVGTVGAVRPMNPANKGMAKATLVGLNPADYIKSLPRSGASGAPGAPGAPVRVDARGSSPGVNAPRGAAAVAPRFPTPTPAPASASRSSNAPSPPGVDNDDDDDDDSPTMLGARAPGEVLGDSDLPAAMHDKFADTMALEIDDDVLPDLSPREEIDEATKVGARANELHRMQDAHVIVGQGAVGDEATLAIPSSVALGLLPDPSTLGPALPPQTPAQPPVSQQYPPQTPRLPGALGFSPGPPVDALEHTQMASDPIQAPPPWAPPPPQPHAPPPWQASVAPMQQAGPQMQPYQHQQPYPQPSSNPAIPVSQPYPPQQGWGPQPGMTPYSMGPQPPPAPPAPVPSGFQLTPQVMLLAGVGVVCLAIFVIGIVLFVTTKF